MNLTELQLLSWMNGMITQNSNSTPPRKPLTKSQEALAMARAGATDEEIKLLLNLNPRQTQNLKPKAETERARRRVRLRKKQTELAMAGNEQMLRLLGEIELEQTKFAAVSQNRNLPNFDLHPHTGYPDDDPRSIAIQNARTLTAQSLLFFARFIATALQEDPMLTMQEILTQLAESLNLPPQPLPPTLNKKLIPNLSP
jgi:DNA-binding CsgD family transcriptional regulator